MTVSIAKSAFVATRAGQAIALSQMFSVTATGSNPAYLVLSGLDRNEYAAGATDATGTVSGNFIADSFASAGGDFRAVGIVFTYNAATGQYLNSTYGALSAMVYNASGSANDLVNLSLYGFSNLSAANAYAGNPAMLMQLATAGVASYLGSASVATQPSFTGAVPTQATPQSIAAAALSFVGDAWNESGCWVLASTIATDAGAALPITSTEVGAPALASGEWFAAYDGPVSASSSWESQVRAGEVISFQTGSGGGHIVTVVSGVGNSAMIVDNVTYVNASGQVTNAAGDGSASDVLISAPHPFSQELSGVPATSVVIYELDTPVVTTAAATATLAVNSRTLFTGLFSAADPKGTAIAEYQVYESNAADAVTVGGTTFIPTSAATAVTAASLAAITLDAAGTAGADTIDVRAFNGSYWGDWTALSLSVSGTQAPPVVAQQTPNQSWSVGQPVSVNLAAAFSDPQGQALTLSVAQANGSALPGSLVFNPVTDMLTGYAPITPETLGLKVTATDTGGLATSEVFQASVISPIGPVLAMQTGPQSWVPGSRVNFALPSGTFTDAVTQHLAFSAYQTSGPNVTSWLRFNGSTDTLSGTVPRGATGTVGLEVIARDGSGLMAADNFTVQIGGSTGHATAAFSLAAGHLVTLHA